MRLEGYYQRLRRLRQGGLKFKASLGNTMRSPTSTEMETVGLQAHLKQQQN